MRVGDSPSSLDSSGSTPVVTCRTRRGERCCQSSCTASSAVRNRSAMYAMVPSSSIERAGCPGALVVDRAGRLP